MLTGFIAGSVITIEEEYHRKPGARPVGMPVMVGIPLAWMMLGPVAPVLLVAVGGFELFKKKDRYP